MNTYPAITRHWPNVAFMCADIEDGGPVLEQHWVNASCLLGCGHSWSANSSHWHNVSLIVAHRLQHWAGISPALAYQYIGLNKINVHPMLAYCWPMVYDHGSAVKQYQLAKCLIFAGNTGNSIPWHNVGLMLEECHRWWHTIQPTLGQCKPKGGSEISGKEVYILALQVNKYGLLAALWQKRRDAS